MSGLGLNRMTIQDRTCARPPDDGRAIKAYDPRLREAFEHFKFQSRASLPEFPPVHRGCPTRCLSKRAAERAYLGVTETERDVRHRIVSVRQQQLGDFHATLHLVLMRRNAERLFECPAEMTDAQWNLLGQFTHAHWPLKMLS